MPPPHPISFHPSPERATRFGGLHLRLRRSALCASAERKVEVVRPRTPTSAKRGQSLAELVIGLLVLIILISGVTTLATLSLQRLKLREEVRREAGKEALARAVRGQITELPAFPEARSHTLHRINAHTQLEAASPALLPLTPMTAYTLAAHDLPDSLHGHETEEQSRTITLGNAFIELIYGKGTVRLRESVTFPATNGLWK